MKYLIKLLILISLSPFKIQSQDVKLEVDGAIKIGSVETFPVEPGTIRWSGKDFEGWNGFTWVSLTSFQIESIVSDLDGNNYHTVRIGSQVWMAENLRTTKYANGNAIPFVEDGTIWSGLTVGAYCWFNNNPDVEIPYGKSYNWFAAADTRNICPGGWRVPTNEDWDTLAMFLGGEEVAGGKMKEPGTLHWIGPNIGASNSSGFTGLGGGGVNWNFSVYDFGVEGSWWSSDGISNLGYVREVTNSHIRLEEYLNDNRIGHNVRCLKN